MRKLLPRNSIEKELKVQIAVSGIMDNAIQLWKDMYENHPPWEGKEGTLCTNLPATIAEEMARLVLTEFELSTTGSQLAKFHKRSAGKRIDRSGYPSGTVLRKGRNCA